MEAFLSILKMLSLFRIQDIYPDASRSEILQIYISFIQDYDTLYQKHQKEILKQIYQYYTKEEVLQNRQNDPGTDEEKIQNYEQEEKIRKVFSLWEDAEIIKTLQGQYPDKNKEELLKIHKKQVEKRESQDRMTLTQKALAIYTQKKYEIENCIQNEHDKNRKEALLWYKITQIFPDEPQEKLQEYYQEQKNSVLAEENLEEQEFKKTSLDAQSLLSDYNLDKEYSDWKKKYYID